MAPATKAKKRSPSLAQRQRMKSKKCKGTNRSGKPCTKPAGWGTDHPGSGNCKHHLGSTRNGAVDACKDEAHGMSKPLRITPGQAIQGVLHLAAGQLAWVSTKVAELNEGEEFEELTNAEGGVTVLPNRWLRLQRQLQQDLKQYSKAAADMGIQERQTALAEAQTQMFHKVLEAILDELDLSAKQRKQVGPAIRKLLPQFVEGQAVEVPA